VRPERSTACSCDALFRLITDAVGRRRGRASPTARPPAADKDQTAEMAATDWGVI